VQDGTYPSFFDIICMDEKNKEIIVLTEKEHIRQRSHIYTGPVKPIEEKVPIIVNKKLTIEPRVVSVALYKIFNEILDNALDECKRMKGKMKLITVSIESKKNRAIVRDTGNGFYKGASKNKISGKSNIETAVSMLRSGSNFNNQDNDEALIGNNGVGSALCNCLSDEFKIITVNDSHYYEQTWLDFESVGPNVRKKESSDKMGTEISFIPLKSLFGSSKWDKEIITSALCLKKRLIKKDSVTKNLELEFYWDGVKIPLDPDCFPSDAFSIETAIGEIIIWEKYENSGSLSFVNSAMCTGIHQKILNDFINLKLEDTLGHHFYDTYMSIGLPPKLVSFRDQNKTRFDTPRDEVEGTISRNVLEKMGKFFSSPLYKSIKKQVDDRKRESELKKIRKDKKTVRIKNSNKYFPPASTKHENLFIVEGLSSMGSILQKRDTKKDGVYALKGKIKNARTLGDLSDNREILELMQILNLDPEGKDILPTYDKVIIATDQDPDGAHITSLIINLFYLWFPWMIKQGRIQILDTPLVSVGDKSKKYFYSLEDFVKSPNRDKTNVRYLKGLGSLSLDDWEFVMSNKKIKTVTEDKKTKFHLDMAFGKSSEARKKWLSSK